MKVYILLENDNIQGVISTEKQAIKWVQRFKKKKNLGFYDDSVCYEEHELEEREEDI